MTEQDAQAIMAQAAGIDAAEGQEQATAAQMPTAGGVAAASADNGAMDWVIIPEMLGTVITMALPEVEAFYTTERHMMLAERLAAVARKRGWSGASSTPEISLAFGAVMFMAPAYMAYKHRLAVQQAADSQGATLDGKPVVNGAAHGH
ncbi:hypothetical protein [Pseudoduganella sp. UC29_71]|uniref:hypothetical protein n=1 Tax=Pseudoduganella sp. UC29_71 TaxID=3350174 RepID=UPI00366EF0D9